jgi:hypothetical protein
MTVLARKYLFPVGSHLVKEALSNEVNRDQVQSLAYLLSIEEEGSE